MPRAATAGWARLLLALLFTFFSEIWLWNAPEVRPLAAWLPLLLGYGVVACLCIEVMVRWRTRDIYSLLAVAGLYALLNALLLNPERLLVDFPRTLFTRVMGAHALAGLLALTLFCLLLRTRRPRTWGLAAAAAAISGGVCGAWARGSTRLLTGNSGETAHLTILIAAGAGLALLWIVFAFDQRAHTTATPIQPLPIPLLAAVVTAALVLFIFRIGEAAYSTLTASMLVIVGALCLGLVYFRARAKPGAWLEKIDSGVHTQHLLLLLIALFLATTALGYALPRGTDSSDPAAVLTTIFSAFGFVWLPTTALVIGARAFSRLVSAGRL